MSNTFDKLLAKGKAKVQQYANAHQSHPQGYPNQGYPGQQVYGYPSQSQGENAEYLQQQHPQYQYQQQQPNQQWSAPQQQWVSQPPQPPPPPPPQQQQQWGPPPSQGQPFAPPVPLSSKPRSSQSQSVQSLSAPPIPHNRPISAQSPPPQNMPPAQYEKVYWKPSFDLSTPVSRNFRHECGDHGWGNNEKQMYTDSPANSFHHDSRLIVRALVQNGSYTSARLTSHQTLSRPRGYLTATILAPVAEGIWPAYWMLPRDPFQWPNDGEIDIFESWNGECMNHSCLHWGQYNGADSQKHRVRETHLPQMARQPHTFGFAWIEEDEIPGSRGRLLWYIDGRPVMKANIPPGTRRLEEYRILINIAMGGNVCCGRLPTDGFFDMVVSDLKMCEEPIGGWNGFEQAWSTTTEGNTM